MNGSSPHPGSQQAVHPPAGPPPGDEAFDARDALGDGRTPQGSLLIAAPVRDGALKSLQSLLHSMAYPAKPLDLETNPVIPFRSLRSVHFARLLILPESSGPPTKNGVIDRSAQIPAQLLLATDFDGTVSGHLRELIDVATPGLDQLFEHCEGWPGLADRSLRGRFVALADFVGRHSKPSNTFYSGTVKRTVGQIRREDALREAIEDFLDKQAGTAGFPTDAVGVHKRIRAWVFNDPRFAWVHQRPAPFPKVLLPPAPPEHPEYALTGLLIAVLVLVGLIVWKWASWRWALAADALIAGIALAATLYVRYLSARDEVIIGADVPSRTAALVGFEDHIAQNQITTINYIKRPLWFRRAVLGFLLTFTNIVARFGETQGTLSGISSIHFARWVIVDRGRRLLFFSNFDGSWEGYLGEFVDKAHAGLTGIWSNVVGFPRAKGLFGEGASDEQRFKAIARDSQVVTDVWYSAYRSLTVPNVNDNTRLRLGLYRDLEKDDAAIWLRMAVPRITHDGPPRPVPRAAIEKDDVQGLVVRSYRDLQHAAFVPVAFDNAQVARAWLKDLIPCVTLESQSKERIARTGDALNVAFSRQGLATLGLADDVVGFSREFVEGMAGSEHRQRLLGDTDEAAPSTWQWGSPSRPRIDAMLFVYAVNPDRLEDSLTAERDRAARHGVTLHPQLPTFWIGDKEHFGFNDGIAQPRIAGLGRDDAPPARDAEIPAGEVILGYENAYGQVPMSPTVRDTPRSSRHLPKAAPDPADLAHPRDFGRNGTYLVLRQLFQDVQAFWRDVDERAGHDGDRRKLLAARMIGRWPNGAPLVRFKDAEPAKPDPQTGNDFSYRDDLDGDGCPIGAHIRRTHPRDSLQPNTFESLRVAARHRLLRRGRVYGPPLSARFDPDEIINAHEAPTIDRGLYFICLNTDIARQFEFVQSAWMNNPKFDGLYADPDAVIAPHPAPRPAHRGVTHFTIQKSPVRQRHRDLKQFTRMVGGCYLFMPGLNAMRYLVDEGEATTGTQSSRD